MPYYLAVDAGGSRTRCLLADSERILARASTVSIKLQRAGEPEATARLVSMLTEVSTAAAIPLSNVTRSCVGLAGLSVPAVHTWARRVLSAQVSGELLLLGDEEIALEAAFPGAPGVLLIAGTGSHAIGRAADGTLHRAGGWGPILGDEGGGYWIGLEALRSALRAHDPSADTTASKLLPAIQRHWNLASLAEIIELGNATQPAPDFASLAPLVARSAADGDLTANEVLHRAGELLADLIGAVADKAGHRFTPDAQPAGADSRIPVAFTGSVLEHIFAVRSAMTAALSRTLPGAQLNETPVDPLGGALFRARTG